MTTFSKIAKRLLIAGSVVLVTACGSNGITEPTSMKSGYLTTSASVVRVPVKTPATTPTTTSPNSGPSSVASPNAGKNTFSGYNVPAN